MYKQDAVMGKADIEQVTHLDLFSGIGGFAYAIDHVWDNVEHIFCDFDPFCRQVLKKHWPESEIYHDIRQIDTNPFDSRLERQQQEESPRQHRQSDRAGQDQASRPFILTGGFPCQPFSAAGLRRGTADERHLWPEMLRVIRLTKPTWVIAENVRGILTWNEGMVFEQVCTDMEASGYEVQPFIIPAVAVNAPHRRDRVWFIGHAKHDGLNGAENPEGRSKRTDSLRETLANTRSQRRQQGQQEDQRPDLPDWRQNWLEAATELCSVDDGLPVELGGFKLSKPAHRKEQLKAYGNAIVPQVAMEIMRGMAL